MKVMIVDDSLIMRRNIKKYVLKMNYTVVGDPKNGQEAIDAYEIYKPDLVTMDITMPVMDGIEAVKHIVNRYPEANVIMITSHGQEDMVRDAIKYGAKGYVLKPITEDKLIHAIEKLFGKLDNTSEDDVLEDDTLDDDILDD